MDANGERAYARMFVWSLASLVSWRHTPFEVEMMKNKLRWGSAGLVLMILGCGGRAPANLSTHSPDEGGGIDATVSPSRDAAAATVAVDGGLTSPPGALGATSETAAPDSDVVRDAGITDDPSITLSLPPVVNGRKVLDRGDQLRIETVSATGAWIAYTEYAGTGPSTRACEPLLWECDTRVDLKVVASTGGTPTTLATDLDLGFARFVGETLFIMRGNTRVPEVLHGLLENAPELLAWRPGDSEPTSLGVDVDPGAFRSSKDERWVSVEINDVDRDRVSVAELVLIDTATLAVRSVAAKERVRGRFTRDSEWLFFGGGDDRSSQRWDIQRLSLRDAKLETVGQVSDARWQLSQDGAWLVHREDWMLTRTPATGGVSQKLTDASIGGGGQGFDVGKDGKMVSFSYSDGNGSALYSMPLLGGEMLKLVDGVDAILEHYTSTIVYFTQLDVEVSLLWAVSAAGGAPQPLGEYSAGDIESYVLDEQADALLARDATGAVLLLRNVAEPPLQLGQAGRGGRFLPDGRVLWVRDSAAPPPLPRELSWEIDGRVFSLRGEGALALYDEPGETVLEDRVAGPFALDPQRRRWYATTVHDDSTTSLVVDVVP